MAFPAPSIPSQPKPLPAPRMPFSRHSRPERIEGGQPITLERTRDPAQLEAERREHVKIVILCWVVIPLTIVAVGIYADMPTLAILPALFVLGRLMFRALTWPVVACSRFFDRLAEKRGKPLFNQPRWTVPLVLAGGGIFFAWRFGVRDGAIVMAIALISGLL